jgi:hypothetical protein
MNVPILMLDLQERVYLHLFSDSYLITLLINLILGIYYLKNLLIGIYT